MADFKAALDATLQSEGGYVNDPQDSGGETYRGVARKYHSKWEGWIRVDLLKQQANFPKSLDSDEVLQQQIAKFYEINFWDKLQGDRIDDQEVANSIFDFGVNAGVRMSAKLAQLSVGATADGVIGPKTLALLNAQDRTKFLSLFTVSKISRYVALCEKNPKNRKFFYGWVRRALEGA